VILRDERVGGRARVTTDEERVLRGAEGVKERDKIIQVVRDGNGSVGHGSNGSPFGWVTWVNESL